MTHALTLLALSRAGLNRAAPRATVMLLVSGLAADLDWISYLVGPAQFLAWHRTGSHSILVAVLIASATAALFWCWGNRRQPQSVRFVAALAVCCTGASSHLLLDLADSYGIKLLWPFSQRWFAGDLAPSLDPWLIGLLLAALLLPLLFQLVSTEIGARPKPRKFDFGVVAVLALALVYFGGRSALHQAALSRLGARQYGGELPLRAGAFPEASPFEWRGVIETDDAIAELELSLAPGATFDPDRARLSFKPMPSPMLEQAMQTDAVRKFLSFALFPQASIIREDDGYRVDVQDARFANGIFIEPEVEARVFFDASSHVTSAGLYFHK